MKPVRCGSFEQFWHYVMTHYRKRYKESYGLEDKWISLALETYKLGVFSGLGIDPSSRYICEIYKCSYKRMANFIRELGLWVERDWVMPHCLVVYQSGVYIAKAVTVEFEVSVEVPHPFTVPVNTSLDLMIDVMVFEGFPVALIDEAGVERIAEEPVDRFSLSKDVYDRDRGLVKVFPEILFRKGVKEYKYGRELWEDYRLVWLI